jgi:hypothetical protein
LILSHTFHFQTSHTLDNKRSFENILAITEEDEKKHFIQYIQYEVLEGSMKQSCISLRYVNVKVDRSYYLEMANINLNNKNRRRYLFSVLGKRRFGSNSKRIDYYLVDKTINQDTLDTLYKEHNEAEKFEASYVQKTEYSTNEYRILATRLQNSYIFFLDQKNSTQRKRLHKTFCIELLPREAEMFNNIESEKRKVDYLFNKIGKIHFKSLEKMHYKLTPQFKTLQELAESKLVKSSQEMEATSRVNDNRVFRELKQRSEDFGRVDVNIHTKYIALFNNINSTNTTQEFYDATDIYLEYIDNISQLAEIQRYFLDIKSLVQSGSIPYLANKHDNDLEDIFLYMLESFSTWNSYIHDEYEDVKSFNITTVDFIDSLRHLVDMCYKFKHDYKCHDSEVKEGIPAKKIEIALDYATVTSAQKYFNEVELDSEVYDELHELETDIEMLEYTSEYSDELNANFIKFFEGYTSALNPLFEFKDLSYSLMLLSQKLSEYKIDENAEMLLLLLKGLVSDLLEWKRAVLVEQTAEDIHYMDKSFYSNIAQIEMSIEHRDEENVEDEIEFF